MSSAYSPYATVSPASLHDHKDDRELGPHYNDTGYTQNNHIAPTDHQQLLSPYSSHMRSNSASPSNTSLTPADSTTSLYVVASEFGESDWSNDDPFFGANFDIDRGTPSFLEEQSPFNSESQTSWKAPPTSDPSYGQPDAPSPQGPDSIASNTSVPHLTPDTNAEGWSNAESPALAAMSTTSPRVTVSVWGKENEQPLHAMERPLTSEASSPHQFRSLHEDALSVETLHGSAPSVSRDQQGGWLADSETGQRGLAPENRSAEETTSVNQLAATREVDAKSQLVESWVSNTADQAQPPIAENTTGQTATEDDNIPMGHWTVNTHKEDQVYYNGDFTNDQRGDGPSNGSGRIGLADLDLLPARNWENSPMVQPISDINSRRNQPETSAAAMAKFERMCHDNDSFVSYAATWGTRRRSMPSVVDTEGVISGNFFKKLALKGDGTSSRRPSLFKEISTLVRRPSQSVLKRKGTNGEEPISEDSSSSNRRESRDSLVPPARSGSWGIRSRQTPSLNTALVGMAAGAASIGSSTAHTRNGSMSATNTVPPRSPSFLQAKIPIMRPRSRTEAPKPPPYPNNLVGMLMKNGGPPVAQLAKSQMPHDADEDDEDDEAFEDLDIKTDFSKSEDITPTLDGFRQHILKLNPFLATSNQYLVDRIAHQMVVRYKNLQNQKIKHLRAAHSGHCNSGAFCVQREGMVRPLESKSGVRDTDPVSAQADSSDGDANPHEGTINTETFPTGIPMPPTSILPAEFECRICFSFRKFIKPSDWTKHVHEDVQPFTCTWDHCREPKMFKRKADWVRHENEGHRHLEWWTCDVDECKHTCYRRDNFLQHLVREHKFAEPKVKTKAAVKKSGQTDLTWQKVEECHAETPKQPQEESCSFCGKTFPSWKKLTVHLAKHMEQISLPVLRLVSTKDLNQDTIISPVQDPPPRSFPAPTTPVKIEEPVFTSQRPHAVSNPIDYNPHGNLGFQAMAQQNNLSHFYNQGQANPQFGGMGQAASSGLMMPQGPAGYPQTQYSVMPVTTGGQFGNAYVAMQNQAEPFPAFNNDALGLQYTNGQMPYDNMAPTVMPADQSSYHGSVSPYSRSPHPGNNGFYMQ
ncbi:hypothetical protein PFICI_01354 [Pestalotiopsis fici W106-1]|uniref:C2H2-type domain-containing protein n=1 Tax=Pestalotiopsis fici (strain W106-1 / CGMCC3.15140) TaxID=1229662 RepID=W3XQI2_PESFW|nr:uncharacterized protein PFICI_01354 [Pestalotiopsis fici W106-1]ETS87526.1 hypothetical protein PFICI_01354 [Pestalotiopsis fici W106-1]